MSNYSKTNQIHYTREDVIKLILAEGWEIENRKVTKEVTRVVNEPITVDGIQYFNQVSKVFLEEVTVQVVLVYDSEFEVQHPFNIHRKLVQMYHHPEIKYHHLKRLHDILFPSRVRTWNYWEDRVLRALAHGFRTIVLAGGANLGKSDLCGRIGLIFYLVAPDKRNGIISSTTLESLEGRVWGYVLKFLNSLGFPVPVHTTKQPMQFRCNPLDSINCLKAIAIPTDADEDSVKNWIGRHSEGGTIMIIDESPDTSTAVINARPNLDAGYDPEYKPIVWFYIGNSKSRYDLHGAMATSPEGNETITPQHAYWTVKSHDGICLYFNPYESPAILEPDPDYRESLKHLPTSTSIAAIAVEAGGVETDQFWRMAMGFWKEGTEKDTLVSTQLINEAKVTDPVMFSGMINMYKYAGLDPSFSAGGDNCVLRIVQKGHLTNGQVIADFKGEEFLYYIKLSVNSQESIPIQIANQVLEILRIHNIPLNRLAIDVTGQGRALADVIKLKSGTNIDPIKVMSVGRVVGAAKRNNDVEAVPAYSLWYTLQNFLHTKQVRRLDAKAIKQFITRKVIINKGVPTLEPKPEYKTRMMAVDRTMGRSPDEADAAALALHAMIRCGDILLGQTKPFAVAEKGLLELALETGRTHFAEPIRRELMAKPSKTIKVTYQGTTDNILSKNKYFT